MADALGLIVGIFFLALIYIFAFLAGVFALIFIGFLTAGLTFILAGDFKFFFLESAGFLTAAFFFFDGNFLMNYRLWLWLLLFYFISILIKSISSTK